MASPGNMLITSPATILAAVAGEWATMAQRRVRPASSVEGAQRRGRRRGTRNTDAHRVEHVGKMCASTLTEEHVHEVAPQFGTPRIALKNPRGGRS